MAHCRNDLAAGLDHVAAVNNGEVVGVVPGGVGEQLLRADVGVADVADVGEAPASEQQPGGDARDAELRGDVAQAFVGAAVVARDVVDADARFVHQRRADGARPVQHSVQERRECRSCYTSAGTS